MTAATESSVAPKIGRRIWVVGSSGSGKSTLGLALSELLRLPRIEFDALFHGPNWTAPDPEIFRARVVAALEPGEWVCDGNYSAVREMMLERAETIIWLDLSFQVAFSSMARRTFRRYFRKEILWNGNRERLWPQFFARDSLFWWVIKTHRSRRRRYAGLFARPEVAPRVLRFTRRSEVNQFLEEFQTRSIGD